MLKGSKDKVSSKIQQGFTIIEVIIVLVIAAIIMLAVFLVVPQLQRTQRNTRNQAVARQAFSAGEQWAANNANVYPTTIANLQTITGTLLNANGSQFTLGTTITPAVNEMSMWSDVAACTSSTVAGAVTTGAGKFKIVVSQETSASATGGIFCISN